MMLLVILAWLATGLGLGYGWSRAHIRANKAETLAKRRATLLTLRADLLAMTGRTVATQARTIDSAWAMFRKARSDADWERLMHAITQSERDMYETAFRRLLEHQARAELIEPDAANGKVLRFERAGR